MINFIKRLFKKKRRVLFCVNCKYFSDRTSLNFLQFGTVCTRAEFTQVLISGKYDGTAQDYNSCFF